MVDINKEKDRKKRWYEENKERLKKERASKKVEIEPAKKDEKAKVDTLYTVRRYLTGGFYITTCIACTSILIYLMAGSLGYGFYGWCCAILLEIGIVTFGLVTSAQKTEAIAIKVGFVLFLAISTYVLYAGVTPGMTELQKTKLDLAKQQIANSREMPATYTTRKSQALKTAMKTIASIKTLEKNRIKDHNNTNVHLAIRFILIFENLIFARLLKRVFFQDK